MNRNYIFLTAVMFLLAAGLLFLPDTKNEEELKPETLLWEIIQPTRFVSVDEVAKRIIEQDPTLILADVRQDWEYESFSLPKSINLPLDSLTNPNYTSFLNIVDKNVVFYSNNEIMADQAWVIAKRLGFKHIYVMKGGLNDWFDKIMDPKMPESTASLNELELYQFRCGAKNFFTGNQLSASQSSTIEVKVKKREKSSVELGGC